MRILAAGPERRGGVRPHRGCRRNTAASLVWQAEPADLAPNSDADGDALDDTLEDRLAERFAPVVFHGDRETAFPVSVETWLRHSSLGLVVNGRWVRRVVGGLSPSRNW